MRAFPGFTCLLSLVVIAVDALASNPAAPSAEAGNAIQWREWTDDLFTKAKAENRFVLLHLGAGWCHWCHVMERTTYKDPEVIRLIGSNYVAVHVDQDSRPDLSNRYEEYGWPATIVFGPDGGEIVKWQQLIREVILAPHVQDYVARLTLATHPEGPFAVPITNQYLRWGSSPRGAQTLTLAAKVRALLSGRYNVSFEDVRRVFLPAMRHRVILNFEAEAEGVDPDKILLDILQNVPEKAEDTKVA